jgi:beta-glucosidase
LIGKMTLAEKIGQLEMSGPTGPNGTPGQTLLDEVRSGQVGSVLDLVGVDNINQVQQAALQSRLVSASEATADGIKWTFNPMVDISHDPRWGRVVEGAGEDPFLGSAMAAAKVKGYQGSDFRIRTCAHGSGQPCSAGL